MVEFYNTCLGFRVLCTLLILGTLRYRQYLELHSNIRGAKIGQEKALNRTLKVRPYITGFETSRHHWLIVIISRKITSLTTQLLELAKILKVVQRDGYKTKMVICIIL
jgi:hypothetical protein